MKTTLLTVTCILYALNLSLADAMNRSPYSSDNQSSHPSNTKTKIYHSTRTPFSKEEDAQLTQLVSQYGTENVINWKEVANQMKNRNPRQCRDRWNHFLSAANYKQPWTKEEDDLLLQKYGELGPKWLKIAKILKRGLHETKNRWANIRWANISSSHRPNLYTPLISTVNFSLVNFSLNQFHWPAVYPIPLPWSQSRFQSTPAANQADTIQRNTLVTASNPSSTIFPQTTSEVPLSTDPLVSNVSEQEPDQIHQDTSDTDPNLFPNESLESFFDSPN